MKDADTLRRIAEEMRTYAKRWEDAEELERIAERLDRAARPSFVRRLLTRSEG